MNFKTIFWQEKEWVMAKVIGFNNAVVQSTSIEEAKDILKDAMITIISNKLKRNETIKVDPTFEDITNIINKYKKQNAIMGFITIDDKLINENFFKTERTNLSVMKGYKELAKKEGINLSAFLNKALEKNFS